MCSVKPTIVVFATPHLSTTYAGDSLPRYGQCDRSSETAARRDDHALGPISSAHRAACTATTAPAGTRQPVRD
ncbi:hypothetical protein FOMPIDRAFT_1026529 [Fomitopsis schrenkii]|uniref:Uncharacterized protein n=1 Tax=Fomitopsis schrenkii TaxID=2126942 RepID=S8DNC5_FOMSC|nr:hypothetical protein FOMPIDRAFT_1026696 [Fomitopsis schrenkii]EPS93464.1 hypothetical protein FOMPIDRAFT_1026529 [Fomitopsis schrenkii]